MTTMPKNKKAARKSSSSSRKAVKNPAAKARKAKSVDRPAKPAGTAEVRAFKEAVLRHLKSTFVRDPGTATRSDWWMATCMAVRDRILEDYIDTQARHASRNVRRVYYLSLEYLMGRVLTNNLVNTGLRDVAARALAALGQDLEQVTDEEADMGLGNGGLGRAGTGSGAGDR